MRGATEKGEKREREGEVGRMSKEDLYRREDLEGEASCREEMSEVAAREEVDRKGAEGEVKEACDKEEDLESRERTGEEEGLGRRKRSKEEEEARSKGTSK